MPDTSSYTKDVQDRVNRAAHIRNTLLDPIRRDNGYFTPTNAAEAKERDGLIAESAKNSVYGGAGEHSGMLAAIHSRALQVYESTHGCLPSDDVLASAHKAIENALAIGTGKVSLPGIFESATNAMSTTDGIIMRDRMVSLILPVMLQSITSNIVTYVPGNYNQSEFFRINRVAASTFGSLQKGDVIDYSYDGLYGVMDQRVLIGTGDGSTKDFTFTSATEFGVAYPFTKKRIKIIHDHEIVGADNGSGALSGVLSVAGTSVVVSGTVDYTTGIVTVSFSTAPADGIEVHLGFDVDIEKAPELIPIIDHVMDSHVLYPHESAIAGNASLQALWAMRREFGHDIQNMYMQSMRNMLAADKDRKHLKDMYFYARGTVEWDRVGSSMLTLKENYETLKRSLLEVSSNLMKATGISGLVGMVGGTDAVNVMKYLPAPFFEPAPGYREIAQPHYVGRIFGQWDVYCDPWKQDSYSLMCFARGPEHGQTAYVAGDAIPAISFTHPVMGDLRSRATMWELAYRDMQPFDGAKYLTNLVMVNNAEEE